MIQKCQNKLKRKGIVKLTHTITISIKLTRKILMFSKRYESTDVDRRTWLHVPSGTGPPALTLNKLLKYKKDFYQDVDTILNQT